MDVEPVTRLGGQNTNNLQILSWKWLQTAFVNKAYNAIFDSIERILFFKLVASPVRSHRVRRSDVPKQQVYSKLLKSSFAVAVAEAF